MKRQNIISLKTVEVLRRQRSAREMISSSVYEMSFLSLMLESTGIGQILTGN